MDDVWHDEDIPSHSCFSLIKTAYLVIVYSLLSILADQVNRQHTLECAAYAMSAVHWTRNTTGGHDQPSCHWF